jgi:hypothetical protein
MVVKVKHSISLMPELTIGMRRVWQNNVKTNIREVSCDGGRWNWLRILNSEQVSILTADFKTVILVLKKLKYAFVH